MPDAVHGESEHQQVRKTVERPCNDDVRIVINAAALDQRVPGPCPWGALEDGEEQADGVVYRVDPDENLNEQPFAVAIGDENLQEIETDGELCNGNQRMVKALYDVSPLMVSISQQRQQ